MIEKVLLERKDLLSAILYSLGEGMVVTDREDKVALLNNHAEEVFGIKREEILGRKLTESINELAVINLFRQVRSEGKEIVNREIGITYPQSKTLSATITPLRSREGNIEGMVALFKDISAVKRMEKEVEEVARLTTLGSLSSWMAHEIRNPLNSIAISLELLQEEVEGLVKEELREEPLRLMKVISDEIHRLNESVHDFLSFDKPPSLNVETTDINQILNGTLSLIQPEAVKRGVKIRKGYRKKLPTVQVDAKKIRQAILNVIINSIQAMPQGGELHLITRSRENWVEIEIRDSGVGIPEKAQEKIFDFFFTTREEGAGLGLSITRKIVNEHGGDIQVESKENSGTRVILRLPLYLGRHKSVALDDYTN
ncbi:MAG: PAS domain-containing protein [Nitrospirae bacterium]|nr:PAS domain-containing protein [Nitrospirota bacterium]